MNLTFMQPGWIDRAVNTAAQTATALLIVLPATGADWLNVLYGVGIATGMSLLRSASGSSTPSPEAIAVAGGAAAGRAARDAAKQADAVLAQVQNTVPLPPVVRDQVQRTINVGSESVDDFVRRMGWKR